MTRRPAAAALIATLALALMSQAVFAQSKTVRIIVPYTPGSGPNRNRRCTRFDVRVGRAESPCRDTLRSGKSLCTFGNQLLTWQ